ncbi:hypothetical protein DLH72_00545 [Candidatus Gracilibacteria bacterium]|nr:MAG: hypothetical protein DLH72_00545 [Candidatus Gracilibacteria bacterium]
MRTNDANLNKNLKKFKAISLSELNATASFLKRIDRKYLLTYNQFLEILGELKNDFKVLEIGGKKVFTYDNVYMDTADYLFYKQHQNKLKSRTKVRTRYYVDSNLAFFEFKQKVNGVTSKYRYEFPSEEHGFMTKGKKRFFDGVWQSLYNGKQKTPSISPAIKTNYKRITMVSNSGDERMTIDFNVKALDLRKSKSEIVDLKNLIIIESKSLKKDCIATKIMQERGISEASSCSKYSLGVVYSGLAEKYDTFKETMNKIKEIRMETVKTTTKRGAKLENFTKEVSARKEEKVVMTN